MFISLLVIVQDENTDFAPGSHLVNPGHWGSFVILHMWLPLVSFSASKQEQEGASTRRQLLPSLLLAFHW